MVKASTSLYAPPFTDAAIVDQAVTSAIHSQPTAIGATITTQATGIAARFPPKIPDTNVLTHNPNPINKKSSAPSYSYCQLIPRKPFKRRKCCNRCSHCKFSRVGLSNECAGHSYWGITYGQGRRWCLGPDN